MVLGISNTNHYFCSEKLISPMVADDDVCVFSDVDDCMTGVCDHNCNNTHGGYVCSCNVGYTLDVNLSSCNGEYTYSTMLYL